MNIEMIEQPSTELTVQDRAAIALASDKRRMELTALATKYATITEIKNKAGRDECHSAAMTLAGARIAISKKGKAARDDATKFSKAVIAEEASLIAITEPEEKRLLALRDEWDKAVAAERAAREAAEKARIMAITERIAGIRQYVELAASCRTAERIQSLQDKLAEIVIEGFGEFQEEAESVWKQAGEKVEALLTAKLEHEAEQARIKAEQEAQAAALKAEREAFAAEQAKAKAEAYRLAAIATAEAAKQDAKVAAAQAALDAQRAEHEAEVQRATQASLDAADAEAALVAMERQLLADERAEFEASVRAAELAKQQAEDDRLAAIVEAEWAEADRIEALREIETPAASEVMPDLPAEQPSVAPACCAPDGVCTDACSKDDAREESAMWTAITNAAPSDSDVMWIAISAVAREYGWTTEQATTRLAEVQWTI